MAVINYFLIRIVQEDNQAGWCPHESLTESLDDTIANIGNTTYSEILEHEAIPLPLADPDAFAEEAPFPVDEWIDEVSRRLRRGEAPSAFLSEGSCRIVVEKEEKK